MYTDALRTTLVGAPCDVHGTANDLSRRPPPLGRRGFGTALAALVVAMAWASPGTAQTFTPIVCPTSGYTNFPNFPYNTASELPWDTLCTGWPGDPCPHYTTNFATERYFIANRHVNRVRFSWSRFETETGQDTLEFWRFGSSPPLQTLSGNLSPGTTIDLTAVVHGQPVGNAVPVRAQFCR